MSTIAHRKFTEVQQRRGAAFFQDVFGWDAESWDGPMEYWLLMTKQRDPLALDDDPSLAPRNDPMDVHTIDVDNLDAVVARIESNGGTMILPKLPIPGIGWLAYFKDPEGHIHGIMQTDDAAA